MNEFDKIVQIAENDIVQLSQEFKNKLNTELCLGMTRYACRYGSLSDGHEKITPSQRYYQAIKEMWSRSNSLIDLKALAMEAQADLIDADAAITNATTHVEKLRAQSKYIRAANKLKNSLVEAEDTNRQLDEFNKVRLELEQEVKSKYPGGIEQAEPDNWYTVAKYRIGLENTIHQPQMLRHVPLDPNTKARLAVECGKPELGLWKALDKPDEFAQLVQEVTQQMIAEPAPSQPQQEQPQVVEQNVAQEPIIETPQLPSEPVVEQPIVEENSPTPPPVEEPINNEVPQ